MCADIQTGKTVGMNVFFPGKMIVFLTLIFLIPACNNEMNITTDSFQYSSEEDPVISTFPKPDHVVIVILENHEYFQVVGSLEAPYINSLVKDTYTTLFTRSYIIEHPSQPNYLDLFSGDNQGVNDDFHPDNEPFTTPNLARQLIDAGKSFVTYSEDLPMVGYNGDVYGHYVRKHNPAANWMGTGKNQIPPTTNQPFTVFPSDYNKLPTVCYVVPSQIHDMHNGSVPAGDDWVKKYLDAYIQWAKTHNSLFILTFDEDNYGYSEHIVTLFTGEMVKGGSNKMSINHFNVLRTIEWMYGLPYAGEAAKVKTIDNCWR